MTYASSWDKVDHHGDPAELLTCYSSLRVVTWYSRRDFSTLDKVMMVKMIYLKY